MWIWPVLLRHRVRPPLTGEDPQLVPTGVIKWVAAVELHSQFIVLALQRVNVLILREEHRAERQANKCKPHTKEKRQTETARFGPISGQMVGHPV